MRIQWASCALVGAAHALHHGHPYLEEAMRGERIHGGVAVYDEPEWVPTFRDQSAPYRGVRIPRENWETTCTSEYSDCKFAIDGSNSTAWRSQTSGETTKNITIDLQDRYAVSAVVVLPPVNLQSEKGLITQHRIFVSNDGEHWTGPVAYGMWPNTNRQRLATFEPISSRYVRLVADGPSTPTWVGISEINIYATLYTIPQDPAKGVWGPTINLPVVPAAAAQEAGGQIMLWSSWDADKFHATPGGKTAMARWDYRTKTVSKRVVTDTQHDMFCPGISIDGTGMMVVTGGNDAAQTSLYNAAEDKWERGEAMITERGYQASTTLSDGRVFVIGGSWAGNSNVDKNGEVYSPVTRSWTSLPGAKVAPIYTDDIEGPWRADNHGWIFGWKNGSVFHAGPSVKMHWFDVDGEGSVEFAGERTGSEDSMSGNAVMFDAVAGKILTFGGSADYDKAWANKGAHIITLGGQFEPPTVEPAGENGEMTTERVFHTSVVLPDGTVFISGGQDFGIAFNEENTRFTPELYNPETNRFTPLQKNNLVRVYHSVSILAPDATVITGGGGLCGNCSANHYDAQVYTPPYLLTPRGKPRKRPTFYKWDRSQTHSRAGGVIKFQSREEIPNASLIRISSNTHTVNTDQRRVPLEVKLVRGNIIGLRKYEILLPEDSGILIPGYWMLFIMNKIGTPSVAQTIFIKSNEDIEYAGSHATIEVEESASGEDCEQGFFHTFWQKWRSTKLIVQMIRRRWDSS